MKKLIFILFIFLISSANAFGICDIATLTPGQWCDTGKTLNASGVVEICTSPCYGMPNGITAYSGGTYDSYRHQLLIFGGGHGDGNGNEVYAFDLDTQTWERIMDRTGPPCTPRCADGIEVLADGTPNSRHTYDGMLYLPIQDDMWIAGGSLASGSGGGSKAIWQLDLATKVWTRKTDRSAGTVAVWSAYNSITGKIIYGGDNWNIGQFDPVTGTHTALYAWVFPGEECNAVIDTERQLLVLIGNGYVYSYDLNNTGTAPVLRGTTGGVSAASGPGIVYNSSLKKIVCWSGVDADRRTVWELDTGTWTWTSSVGTGDIPDAPAHATYSRTYGRWQYSPELNVYMVWNRPSGSVYLYRHSATSLSLTNRTWMHRTYSPMGSGAGVSRQSKHTRTLYDSALHKLVNTGGDPQGPHPCGGYGSNYVWSQALLDGDIAWTLPTGWTNEWCPEGGTEIPWRPDNVVWVYDSTRQRYIMAGGQYLTYLASPTSISGCSQTSVNSTNVAFTFDPATGNWTQQTSWPTPAGGWNITRFGVYDPTGDAIFVLSTNKISRLSLSGTPAWTYYTYTNPGGGEDVPIMTQPVIDVQGRQIYWMQRNYSSGVGWCFTGYMMKADISTWPTPTVTRSATAASGFGTNCAEDFETYMAFDTSNRVIMVPDYPYQGAHAGRLNQLFFYNVDAGTWEHENAPPEPFSGSLYVRGNSMAYDQYNNVFAFIGGNDNLANGYWIYRYAGGNQPSQHQIPVSPSNLYLGQ